jgi:hypothetical protein
MMRKQNMNTLLCAEWQWLPEYTGHVRLPFSYSPYFCSRQCLLNLIRTFEVRLEYFETYLHVCSKLRRWSGEITDILKYPGKSVT